MPKGDILANKEIYRKPMGGNNMADTTNNCNCGCQEDAKPSYPCPPPGYWYPDCPPPPMSGGCCPPPYPYPYPCPVNPGVGSIESQIAKLSKKSATIRKMIDGLVNRNKSIIINIGCSSYNFGTYTTGTELDKTETEYGKAVLEMLETELEAIKAKIIELTGDLEVADEEVGGVESTVTTEL